MLQSFDQLLGTTLLGKVGSLLQLVVLLLQSIVELRQFDLHVILNVLLLVPYYLENLIFKLLLALSD